MENLSAKTQIERDRLYNEFITPICRELDKMGLT